MGMQKCIRISLAVCLQAQHKWFAMKCLHFFISCTSKASGPFLLNYSKLLKMAVHHPLRLLTPPLTWTLYECL